MSQLLTMVRKVNITGSVGSPPVTQVEDGCHEENVRRVLDAWSESEFTVLITGAGLSTAAGVPDYRGSNGIFSQIRQDHFPTTIDLEEVKPTSAHRILRELEKLGKIQGLITQSTDGLLVRAGFSCDRLMEIHGNVFSEECLQCRRVYHREYVLDTFGHEMTGESCEGSASGRPCRGRLVDTIVDWRRGVSEFEKSRTVNVLKRADCIIVLGASLEKGSVTDWCKLEKLNALKFIVNKQRTSKDDQADYIINGDVEKFLRRAAERFELEDYEFADDEGVRRNSEHGPLHFGPVKQSRLKRKFENITPAQLELSLSEKKIKPTFGQEEDEVKIKIDRKPTSAISIDAWHEEKKISIDRKFLPESKNKLLAAEKSGRQHTEAQLEYRRGTGYVKQEPEDVDESDYQGTSSHWFDEETKPNIH